MNNVVFRDQDILSDKYEDVLVNVNIIDNERTKKSLANIKAGKEGYQVSFVNKLISEFEMLLF